MYIKKYGILVRNEYNKDIPSSAWYELVNWTNYMFVAKIIAKYYLKKYKYVQIRDENDILFHYVNKGTLKSIKN